MNHSVRFRIRSARRVAIPIALLIFVSLGLSPFLAAQSQPPASPAFDVASIKSDKSGSGRISISRAIPGRFRAFNANLVSLMTTAYELPADRILGAPEWKESEHFDIEATTDANATIEDKRLMLQSLLADRFKLALHHETRTLKIYALVADKPGILGPQLHPSETCSDKVAGAPPPPLPLGATPSPPCNNLSVNGWPGKVSYSGKGVTMQKLAESLAGNGSVPNLDRPVIDRTGLSGYFDFSLEFAPLQQFAGQQSGADDDAPASRSIFTALKEQLGLKLESQTGDVDVIVIDHVEMPSEN